MKIGRNKPCPCGSGKKYKKCCLDKKVTPPEALHYRRLSEAHDILMPKLVAYGESVFGEMAPQVALAEFLGWPDPEDAPDEKAIERAAQLFWPWYVFNWEYCALDVEEGLLQGPEDVTITELFLEKKQIDSKSLEDRFLIAANRSPFSFHEIAAINAGRTVTIRDILTGHETLVQERRGSEYLQKGDIIFGRAVQVDNVGMFLGLSPYRIPPRMKPEVIEMRKGISRSRGMLSVEGLYEWDLEIRELYWDIDRRLHTIPEMVNTDGEPVEFHKLVYDIDSAELAVTKLADLSQTETLDDILDRAETDENGQIKRAMFSWSVMGNRANKGMPNTILGNVEIEAGRLIVSVNSAERAHIVRAEIERRMADKACFRLDEISDLNTILNQQRKSNGSDPSREALMSHPEVRHQIEQMLRKHWKDWADQKIPLLGDKTPRQAVKTKDGRESVEALLLDAERTSANDPIRSAVEKVLIDDVRRRLKIDEPLVKKQKTIDTRKMAERIEQTKLLISEYAAERLPDIYKGFCLRLCDAIADSEDLNLHLGRVEIWAAAIFYAIAKLNFLFSPETPNCLTTDEICSQFGVKKSTVSNKASTILDILDIFYDDRRFCAPHITQLFDFVEDEHGFIHPVTALASGGNVTFQPIALKPSRRSEKCPKKPVKKVGKQTCNRDDRQLGLFPD
jgi:hypothetical protein